MIEYEGEREWSGEAAIRKCGCLWGRAWGKMEILIQTNGNGSRGAQLTHTCIHMKGLLGNPGTSGMDGPTPASWILRSEPT
ncbi:LOW QUALITY PROTEIN: uncharacterized protein Dsimw501_GD27599 [Drosophila simulans]|uniref:Uncharacterized protein n=1 Tax=Drosophila simulans TaxID=7240 RepID=A0A0J9RDN6_DROSI|nr:LOW QUALITY PROTEIN: uncharacterized protein Dsimw501_GD27599 [Drosophila simulans]